MKKKIPIVALVLLIASVAVSLFILRPPQGNSLWRGYRVLYVPADIPEKTTLQICTESGIGAVISDTEPEIPFIAPLTMPLAVPFVMNTDNSYILRRQGFFTDKNKNYRLYYLPANFEGKFRSLLARFRASGITGAGIDSPETYLWITPAIVFLVLCAFTIFSQARLALLVGGIPMLLFSVVLPQYPVGAAVCLFLYSLFLLQKLWLHRGFVGRWFLQGYGPGFAIFATAICFVFSVRYGILFLVNILGSVSLLFLLASFATQQKYPFLPVKIRPASLIPTITKRTILFTGIPAGGILLLCIFFVFQAFFLPRNDKKDLYFPAPARYTEANKFTARSFAEMETLRLDDADELPDLRSFIIWVWNTLVFPYRSLNEQNPVTPANGTVISIPVYTQTDSGIVASDAPVYVFDDAFIAETLAAVDDAPLLSFEQVLKTQGRFVTVSYMALEDSRKRQDPLILVLLIAAAAISPIAALIFTVKEGFE
jgi:hypothetical protein